MAYMTAVIYARYSSNSQREESIEGQIRECRAFAEKNGYTIIHNYMDRAISGKTDDRPQFQKMIADSKKKLFDTVLVWKLDRFARNRYDSARYKNQLKKNGVRVVSATETISSGAEGILLESMLEGMAEYYSADLAEKVVRGRTENALKCKWNGGTLPIGYIVDEEQHLQPNPLTACFVVDAYNLYDQGHTLTEVRDYLNSKGVKNSLGRPLTYGSIQHMLNNRRYIGEYIYRDIVTPGGIPAIVPQDLFDRVQERLAKNKKAPARAKAEESYILTTKLFCGHCGVYMCGESGKSRNGVVHRYYKCATAKKKAGDCRKKAVKKEWIENLVVDETMAMIMDDKAIENIVSMFMEIQDRENTVLPVLEKELKDTEKAIKNIVSAVEKGMFSESLMHRMEALEAAKADLTVRIEMEKLEKPKISEKEMTFFLHRFRKLNPNIEAHRQILIDTFVNAVYVYDDKLLLTFNFKDGTKTISFADVATATGESGSDMNCLGAPEKAPRRGCFFHFVCPAAAQLGEGPTMRRLLYNLALVLLALIFFVSAYFVSSYYWEGHQQEEEFEQLSLLVKEESTRPAPTEGSVPGETQARAMLPGYAALYAQNDHTVGWLRIEGTKIDYPVMQTPDSPDYYLKRDFQKQESSRGCLYVREACDVFAPSDNVTIYGHAMADGSMFWGLHDFVDRDFWEAHKIACFDTLYECWDYEIFAVFRTTATAGEGFAYHQMENAADQAEFDKFIATCKELSLFDTGITPEYGDKIICLSTCEYTQDNGRLVVAAVRLDKEAE